MFANYQTLKKLSQYKKMLEKGTKEKNKVHIQTASNTNQFNDLQMLMLLMIFLVVQLVMLLVLLVVMMIVVMRLIENQQQQQQNSFKVF